MRTVVDTSMVAHLWANKSQPTARNGRNFSFTGPALYSYSTPIAYILETGDVLLTDEKYSVTTAKHVTLAHRALRNSPLRCIGLHDNELREIERQRREKTRTVPTLAVKHIDSLIHTVQGMHKLREGYRPMRNAWTLAKSREKTARVLCGYVGARYCGPTLPEEIPTGEALQTLIRTVAKPMLLQTHVAECDAAERQISFAASYRPSSWDTGRPLRQFLDNAASHTMRAAAAYKTATGKVSRRVKTIRTELARITPEIEARAVALDYKIAREDVKTTVREAYGFMHIRPRSDWRGAGFYANKLESYVFKLPVDEQGQHFPLIARLNRIRQWDESARGMENARNACESADSYRENYPDDALREYRRARHALDCVEHPVYRRLNADAYGALADRVNASFDAVKAEVDEKYTRRVNDWKTGVINYLPYSAGTYARIEGNSVRTSRGATVPLEHACRLARIVRRVIAHGGQSWPNGAGPIVGGFRVVSIGADARTVIGCHEFEPNEALRVLGLLEGVCDAHD